MKLTALLLAVVVEAKKKAPEPPPWPHLVPPDGTPYVVALAVVGISTVIVVALSVIIRMMGTSKVLLWPTAIGVAAVPFLLRTPLLEWWGGSYADAQLGLFLAATSFAWVFFRTIELSVGNTPDGANASMAEWIFYVGADLDPRYHKGKPLQPPPGKLQSQLLKLLGIYLLMAAWVSVIEPLGFRPTTAFCSALGLSGPLATVVVRVGDNFSGTVLIWLFLWLLFTIGSILVLVQGHDPIDGFDNPVFGSTNPREFWGKRWNLQVNAMLKKCVYKPLAAVGLGGPVATLASFGASAVFHEYQFALSMHGYKVGTSSVFFLGQGLLIVAQALLEATPLRKVAKHVPLPIGVVFNITALSIVPDYFICNWIDLPMPLFGAVARLVPRIVW